MPPYPDVPGALQRLKTAGFLLFTLTDNTAPISGRQLTYGGLIDLFDRRFSVDDTAKRHKPAPEAYAEVTRALGAAPSEMCMVACHTWDTIGAQAAGWEAGLIKRINNDVLDTAAQPQYVGKDLNEVANQIIAKHAHRHGWGEGHSNSSLPVGNPNSHVGPKYGMGLMVVSEPLERLVVLCKRGSACLVTKPVRPTKQIAYRSVWMSRGMTK
jgi:hypothetical protein